MLFVSALTLLTAIGSVAAAPRPQNIDFDAIIDDLPPVTTITDIPLATVTATSVAINSASIVADITSAAAVAATSLAASADDAAPTGDSDLRKRAACDPLPIGYGPLTFPDSAANFLANPELSGAAKGAATPSGYSPTFTNLQGQANAKGWYAYKTLKTYDVQACATWCSSKTQCLGFNILFERDPTITPGPGCTNPLSTNQIKCVLHSYAPQASDASNTGQYQSQFQVVVAGSNGYARQYGQPPTIGGFTGSQIGNGKCFINAPLDAANGNVDTFIRSYTVAAGGYDPSICTAACTSTTQYDAQHPDANGLYKTCNFVVAGWLNGNSVTCALYTKDWSVNNYAGVSPNCPGGNTLSFTYGFAAKPEKRTDVPAATSP